MSRRLRVYIAGPISKGDLQHNIDQARVAGIALLKAGFAPLVPQLTCFIGGNSPTVDGAGLTGSGLHHSVWIDSDLPWVAASDAVLRLPGDSVGADREVDHANSLGIPVYHDLQNLLDYPPSLGDDRFEALLRQMWRLHSSKSFDYGKDEDVFSNVRGSEDYDVPAWIGAMIRANDKVVRIKNFIKKGLLKNESVEDSLMDLAAYSLIALILFREEKGK